MFSHTYHNQRTQMTNSEKYSKNVYVEETNVTKISGEIRFRFRKTDYRQKTKKNKILTQISNPSYLLKNML